MYFEELKQGMTMQIPPVLIEKKKMMDFARVYDNIPLHTDEEYAKASPFGQLIAPGVMSFISVRAEHPEADFIGREHKACQEKRKKRLGGDLYGSL